MSLPKSSLSQVCRAIADFVGDQLQASQHSMHVSIGCPSEAVPSDGEHTVNLFFYRMEPAGFFTGGSPGDTWWIRLQCLVTGFGSAEEKISAGENDLRLLGEVMRLFHEHPFLPSLTVGDETFQVQVIFLPLSADDLSHIWATQTGVSYRPSIVYEMALSPVVPTERSVSAPLVGSIGKQVRAAEAARSSAFSGEFFTAPVPRSAVEVSSPGWAPAICFVQAGTCALSLSFERGSQALADFTPRIWIAGAPGSPVSLAWQLWSSSGGWQDAPGAVATAASSSMLDPEHAPEAITQTVDLPPDLVLHGGQAVLYAERNYIRGLDNLEVTVRSNPLLVTVYGGA